MNSKRPKISVFTTCKNEARYLRETLDSILNQTFKDFEIVLVDGASTDKTINILGEYEDEPRLRWISEPDNDACEGFYKALMMTRGEYVMLCPVSDGYLSRNWFQKCVDVLHNDINISLVYGMTQMMDEFGSLGRVNFSEWFTSPPPDGEEYLPYWLATFSFIPETTYCVRADIYKKTLPNVLGVNWDYYNPPEPMTDEYFTAHGCFLKQRYNFSTGGYLPKFLPVVASYVRWHKDSRNIEFEEYHRLSRRKYVSDIIEYRNAVLSGRKKHIFRDGLSREIRAIQPDELQSLKVKIAHYRMTRRIHFEYQDIFNTSNINQTILIRLPSKILSLYKSLIYKIYRLILVKSNK